MPEVVTVSDQPAGKARDTEEHEGNRATMNS
jgi:hypothetical protein